MKLGVTVNFILGCAALLASGSLPGSAWAAGKPAARSGVYQGLEKMLIAVSGDTVTGVFSAERVGNGTMDAPQFTCVFMIAGTLKGNHARIVTGLPDDAETIAGTLDFTEAGVALRLKQDQGGCGMASDEMVNEPYFMNRAGEGADWTGVALIGARKAVLSPGPAPATRKKPYLVRFNPVAIIGRQGQWVNVRYSDPEDRQVNGWVKASDLIAGHLRAR